MNDWNEIKQWRKQTRARLIALREAADDASREAWSRSITQSLEGGFPIGAGMVVGFCWPYKGEYDIRFPVRTWRDLGAAAALPAVVDKHKPLEFRIWWPGAPMRPEVYDIPVPVDTPAVTPGVLFAPVVGFEAAGFRLGYGGGYFDRTLASITPKPIAIAVGFELQRLDTTYPQPHDVVMDFMVTEAGIFIPESGTRPVPAEQAARRYRDLVRERGLLRSGASVVELASPPCYAGDFPGYFGDEGPGAKGGGDV